MKTIKIVATFTYDNELMHGNDITAMLWFFNKILLKEKLILHSNEIGDEIGTIKIKEILS